ncbi:unnamed protein product, partial [Closterium sp. NIES-53]
LPRWGDLLKKNVAIFDLDFDAILAAMYAATDSAEGDCYLCVLPDPGIEAAALGASESAAPGTSESAAPGAGECALSANSPTEALHTFTLDSGASHSFFRNSTTLTPLSRPVVVSLADPSGGPVLVHSSAVLPCPAASSGLLLGLHLPSFSTNLVSGADLHDAWVDQFAPGGQRVTHCTCSRTGRHLATFTRRPGSSLYTLSTASPPVTASCQVAASGQVFSAASRSSPTSAPCLCRPLSHETLLWHHRLGHPSLPRLRGMASRTLGHERYFLLVVDDYSRYTTFFPLRCKGPSVVWRASARRSRFRPLHSKMGLLSAVLLEPLSPQQLCEWYARRCLRAAGATGPIVGGASRAAGGAAGAGAAGGASRAAGGAARAGAARGASRAARGAAGAGGTGTVGGPAGVGAAGGAGAAAVGGLGGGGALGVLARDPGAEGTCGVFAVSGGAAWPWPYYVPLLQQVLGLPPSTGPPPPPLLSPPLVQGLTERRELKSHPASPESRLSSRESRPELPVRAVCTGRRVPRQCFPPVPGTHSMTMRPSTAPQRVPLPSPPASSLPALTDPQSDSLRTASPTVTASSVIDSFTILTTH